MADSSWLMVDAWECCQSEWTRTALVLRELGKRLPEVDGREVKVMMVSRLYNLSCHCKRLRGEFTPPPWSPSLTPALAHVLQSMGEGTSSSCRAARPRATTCATCSDGSRVPHANHTTQPNRFGTKTRVTKSVGNGFHELSTGGNRSARSKLRI